jgi:hypothetical protein
VGTNMEEATGVGVKVGAVIGIIIILLNNSNIK